MNISQMLDRLSEFQSQVTYLEQKKRELLDEVKIPVEVLSAQDDANKQRQKLDSEMWSKQKSYDQMKAEELAAVVDPEMPPEFVAALAAARAKRAEIEARYNQLRANDAQVNLEEKIKIDADLQAQVQTVYAQVAARKNEITAEFSDKTEAANKNINDLTNQIKDAVKKFGDSVKGAYLQAVFAKGRTTWSTDVLDGVYFMLLEVADLFDKSDLVPDLITTAKAKIKVALQSLTKARKVGDPSVSIRKI